MQATDGLLARMPAQLSQVNLELFSSASSHCFLFTLVQSIDEAGDFCVSPQRIDYHAESVLKDVYWPILVLCERLLA